MVEPGGVTVACSQETRNGISGALAGIRTARQCHTCEATQAEGLCHRPLTTCSSPPRTARSREGAPLGSVGPWRLYCMRSHPPLTRGATWFAMLFCIVSASVMRCDAMLCLCRGMCVSCAEKLRPPFAMMSAAERGCAWNGEQGRRSPTTHLSPLLSSPLLSSPLLRYHHISNTQAGRQ